MHNLSEHNLLIFLIQVLLLLGLARLLGEFFRFWKQPSITAEILAGLFLGPTILGRFFPSFYQRIFPENIIQQNMLETVAWLGMFFFLLESGLKMDFSSAWRNRGKALVIAITGIVVPMAIAFSCCYLLPVHYLVNPGQRIVFSLFMATAMTISSMPTTIRALNDLNVIKTDLGFLIMSALSVNEIIGWMFFALILGIFVQSGAVLGSTLLVFVLAVLFLVLCLTFGRKLADFAISKIKERNMPEPGSSLTFICLLGFFCAAVFQKIGINGLMGFFIAGVIAGEARELPERTRQVISQMVYAIFIPLFFARIGLGMDFLKHFDPFLVLFVTVIGILGKFIGAWLGASFTNLPRVNRLAVAVAHTPGGSMEIVIGLLALKYNLINQPVFIAIVLGGVLSSIILGPWLKYSLCRRKTISVLEFFSRREIIAQVKSTDRDNAIRELCLVAHEEGNMPSVEVLSEAALNRENSMGTAIEKGIALPHARIPSLVRPLIVFGRSHVGIDWDSPDGNPTHFIFLILTPSEDDDIQIQILRIIAKTMFDDSVSKAIMQSTAAQELWQVLQDAFTQRQIVRKE
ncbi:MAG: cation:proton antiporter [Candidatus Omnitrophica bacterium]|nr:cation:proton antiporter [Candidatus Omnitrophota bacterium]